MLASNDFSITDFSHRETAMLRLIVIILFVLIVLAFKFLPWWVVITTGVVLILLSKFLLGKVFLWLFSMPFRAKGKVLRGAIAEVHSVRAAPAPPSKREKAQLCRIEGTTNAEVDAADEDDDTDDEPDVPREYYEIDLTITPQTPTGPFMHWDISDLSLAKPNKPWHETDDDTCRVERVDVVRDGTIVVEKGNQEEGHDSDDENDDDEGTKVMGPRRLKMLVGIVPGVRELVFSYYFESFGKLDLPSRHDAH